MENSGKPGRFVRTCMRFASLFLAVLILSGLLRTSSLYGVAPIQSTNSALERISGIVYFNGVRFTGSVQDGNTLTQYVDGLRHGRSESRYANGQKNYSRTYTSGLESGIHTGWWEDGTLRFRYHFSAGVHHGRSTDWFKNGSVFRDFNYDNGYESGLQKMYTEDGTVRANYVVRDGRRFGLMGTKPCTG